MEKTLHLILKGEWFGMIASGEKKEEYRNISEYWLRRIYDTSRVPVEQPREIQNIAPNMIFDYQQGHDWKEIMSAYFVDYRKFYTVCFQHGYSSTARRLLLLYKGIDIGPAKPEWSGGMQGDMFRIHLGREISRNF